MKTLVVWNTFNDSAEFFWFDGDYSRLNGVYINQVEPDGITEGDWEILCDELLDLVYEPNSGEYLNTPLSDFPLEEVKTLILREVAEAKHQIVVISAGFVP